MMIQKKIFSEQTAKATKVFTSMAFDQLLFAPVLLVGFFVYDGVVNDFSINGLKKEGYTQDFNIREDCIVCHQSNTVLSNDDFEIDKIFRFEGQSNPDDQSILYAISSKKFNVKGTLVNGYGIYADDVTTELVARLQQHH